jgi:hypothetical protein
MDKDQNKICLICAKEMPSAALKCTACGSYQNWRRHLDFGNTFIALLIALISLFSLLASQLLGFANSIIYRLPDFQAIAQISELDEHQSAIFISNQGAQSFISSGMTCQISRPSKNWFIGSGNREYPKLSDVKVRTVYFFEHEPVLWAPGQSGILKLLSFKSLDNRVAPQETIEQKSACIFSFKDSNGNDRVVPIELKPLETIVFAVE